jgi:hypothetical protein
MSIKTLHIDEYSYRKATQWQRVFIWEDYKENLSKANPDVDKKEISKMRSAESNRVSRFLTKMNNIEKNRVLRERRARKYAMHKKRRRRALTGICSQLPVEKNWR